MKKKIILTLSIIAVIIVAIILYILATFNNKEEVYMVPHKITAGEISYKLNNYVLEESGLQVFKDLISRSENMVDKYSVDYTNIELDKNGLVKKFSLYLNIFDEKNRYYGEASYVYEDKKLTYNPPKEVYSKLVTEYNENSSIDYLSEQIKKIPLKEQINVSGLDKYFIKYSEYTNVKSGTPIFDGSDVSTFPVLSKDDYNSGKGGISDGKTNITFKLFNGNDFKDIEYYYLCKPINPEKAIGDLQVTMKCDYFLDNGKIKFTRNYGADWINADIPVDGINETLEFNRNWLELPPPSVFISSDEKLPIAFFYGENPKIRMSSDNGQTWYDVVLPNLYYGDKPIPEDYEEYCKPVTRRVIGFNTPQFGYAALGTDWTMGSGECKVCYFTLDGGKTWERKDLPLECSSSVLFDMAMANEKVGAVALDSCMEVDFPLIYVTNDMGDSWTEITYPFRELPQEIQYLSDIDSFSFEDGVYTLVLGQSTFGTIKATFTAKDLNGPWEFVDYKKTTIHTVG